nr:hypothetical protein Iba_chr02dCG4320 [Ipomoea batatas]
MGITLESYLGSVTQPARPFGYVLSVILLVILAHSYLVWEFLLSGQARSHHLPHSIRSSKPGNPSFLRRRAATGSLAVFPSSVSGEAEQATVDDELLPTKRCSEQWWQSDVAKVFSGLHLPRRGNECWWPAVVCDSGGAARFRRQ